MSSHVLEKILVSLLFFYVHSDNTIQTPLTASYTQQPRAQSLNFSLGALVLPDVNF